MGHGCTRDRAYPPPVSLGVYPQSKKQYPGILARYISAYAKAGPLQRTLGSALPKFLAQFFGAICARI